MPEHPLLEETPNGPTPEDPPQDAPQDPDVIVLGDGDDQ